MGSFAESADRHQASFQPACLEDYVDADNPVRIIDAFVDELDLVELGFGRVQPASTGGPGYAPGTIQFTNAVCGTSGKWIAGVLSKRRPHLCR